MSLDTVEKIMSRVFETGWVDSALEISWHAGEPLAVGPQFYKDALKLINSLVPDGIDIRHNFQTNATLVSDEWCRLFYAMNARVGVSIDGPESLNDLNRTDRAGRSTFIKTLSGLKMLSEAKVDFHVLTVLTASSLDAPIDLFKFYVDIGAREIGFNIDEVEGNNKISSMADSADVVSKFDWFMRSFWNLNVENGRPLRIREFDSMLARVVLPTGSQLYNTLVEPFSVVSFDYNGNFGTFSPEMTGIKHDRYSDLFFGNVHTDSIEGAFDRPSFKLVTAEITSGVDECRGACEYFPVCGGGSPSNKLFEKGTFNTTETVFCRLTTKVLADITMDIVEESATQLLIQGDHR